VGNEGDRASGRQSGWVWVCEGRAGGQSGWEIEQKRERERIL